MNFRDKKMDFYKADGEMKSFEEIEAEYESMLTRADKFFRWWRHNGILLFMFACMAFVLVSAGYAMYSVKTNEHKCEQHNGIMLGGQCIQSDVIHKVNLD